MDLATRRIFLSQDVYFYQDHFLYMQTTTPVTFNPFSNFSSTFAATDLPHQSSSDDHHTHTPSHTYSPAQVLEVVDADTHVAHTHPVVKPTHFDDDFHVDFDVIVVTDSSLVADADIAT